MLLFEANLRTLRSRQKMSKVSVLMHTVLICLGQDRTRKVGSHRQTISVFIAAPAQRACHTLKMAHYTICTIHIHLLKVLFRAVQIWSKHQPPVVPFQANISTVCRSRPLREVLIATGSLDDHHWEIWWPKFRGNMCISQGTQQRVLFKCTWLNNLYQRCLNEHRGLEYSFGLFFTWQEDLHCRFSFWPSGLQQPTPDSLWTWGSRFFVWNLGPLVSHCLNPRCAARMSA